MFNLVKSIDNYFKDMALGQIESGLNGLFTDLNDRVSEVGGLLQKSPSQFNDYIFNFVKNVNQDIILPIAILIITAIFYTNIIEMVNRKNKGSDTEVEDLFKLILFMNLSIWFLSNAFDFTMAIFDISSNLVEKTVSFVNESNLAGFDIQTILETYKLKATPELFAISMEITIVRFIIFFISVGIFVVVYSRIIEIYFYLSVSSLAFSTLGNRQWSSIGIGYIKHIAALALQSMFLILGIGIYKILIQNVDFTNDVHKSLFSALGFTVVLVLTMFKTLSISKSIVGAN